MMIRFAKECGQKPVYKRCRLCRTVAKVHRAARYCAKCKAEGHKGLLEVIYGNT